jgi:condensin complex subunit 3
MDSILIIFDEIQKSQASHGKCSKKLLTLISNPTTGTSGDSVDHLQITLDYLIDSVLGVSKKEACVDRIMKFIVDFFSSKQLDDATFNRAMKHLLKRSLAIDKNVRMRSCQIISEIISKLDPETETSDDLWNSVRSTLLLRLKDKNAPVRMWSLRALASFQSQDDPNDEVILEMKRVMCSDSASSVRAAAVEVIAITNATIADLIEKVRDTAIEVRLQVLDRCIECLHCSQIPSASRELIVKHTLNDREQQVKDKAILLISKWINQLGNKVPKLLQKLNLQTFGDEAEKVGRTIVEAVYNRKITDNDIVEATIQHHPNWSGSFESFNASEVLWVRIRCDYARLKPESQLSDDILESNLPDVNALCDLLADVNPSRLNNNVQSQSALKYVLQLTRFIDQNDVSGCQRLREICQKLLEDLTFPEHLVDTLLDAWACSKTEDSIVSDLIQLADDLRSRYEENADSDDRNVDYLLSSMRYLQITAWGMTRSMMLSAGVSTDASAFEGSISTIISSLQQPLVELRNEAVRCMGLMGMMSEKLCLENKDILMHVVSADMEDPSIRSYALQSVVDYAMVYPGHFKDHIPLINVLIRIQEHDQDSQLACTAAESSIKLIFSGVLTDTRLFALLLREFFFPEVTFIGSNSDDEMVTKLIQSLSIFFQAVFLMDSALLHLALDSISELITDISILLRGSFNDSCQSLGLDRVRFPQTSHANENSNHITF